MPHISIGGFPGVGKTTILKILESWYQVHVIPRFTCRPIRRGEQGSQEYVFVSKTRFKKLGRADFFVPSTVEPVEVNERMYFTATPRVRYWPETPPATELVVSLLGEAVNVIRAEVPDMLTVFITHSSPFVVMKRTFAIDPLHKLHLIEEYGRERIWHAYDHIVFNEGTPEECAEKVARIAGLA